MAYPQISNFTTGGAGDAWYIYSAGTQLGRNQLCATTGRAFVGRLQQRINAEATRLATELAAPDGTTVAQISVNGTFDAATLYALGTILSKIREAAAAASGNLQANDLAAVIAQMQSYAANEATAGTIGPATTALGIWLAYLYDTGSSTLNFPNQVQFVTGTVFPVLNAAPANDGKDLANNAAPPGTGQQCWDPSTTIGPQGQPVDSGIWTGTIDRYNSAPNGIIQTLTSPWGIAGGLVLAAGLGYGSYVLWEKYHKRGKKSST